MRSFPTADQIATAIVAAARITGENPMLCVLTSSSFNCRHLAYEALTIGFPLARKRGLARAVGYGSKIYEAGQLVKRAAREPWWSDIHVDEVIGALVPDEEQAA